MEIKVYTDGSCKPTNPGPAGFGYVILVDGEVLSSGGDFIGSGTNNIAEVKAIQYSLTLLKSVGFEKESISLYTDSQYAVGLFTKGWKPRANVELINSVKEQLKDFSNLEIVWVRGHNGDQYNEMADSLAKKAIDSNANSI